MKINLDCVLCFQRQALQAARFVTDDEKLTEHILREVMKELLELDWHKTPPEMAHRVHKIVRNLTKEKDPYKKIKKKSNDSVLKIYPEIKRKVEESDDPLKTAILFSIVGNIIDYGALEKVNLKKSLKETFKKKIDLSDYETFKKKLKVSKSLLFFADNAGEIGLDKILIETMLKETKLDKIRLVVKSGPIINDATLEDVNYLGLDSIPNIEFWIVSNGENITAPKRNSSIVKKWVKSHDLVISKGQGNYEDLSEQEDIFFMLMAKCPIIANHLNVRIKDMVLQYNASRPMD